MNVIGNIDLYPLLYANYSLFFLTAQLLIMKINKSHLIKPSDQLLNDYDTTKQGHTFQVTKRYDYIKVVG